MPPQIKMILDNGNLNFKKSIFSQNLNTRDALPKSNFKLNNSSMISRIHNIKPGCSSCGR
jgi:hypothetical protein